MTLQSAYVKRASYYCQTVELDRPSDRTVLNLLLHFDLFEKGAFPSYKTLAKLSGLGVTTVRHCVYRLAKREIVVPSKRLRPNGSQASNHYKLRIPRAKVGVSQETPLDTLELQAGTGACSEASPSGSQALRARRKIKTVRPEREEWDGPAHGAIAGEPVAKPKRKKPRIRSGSEASGAKQQAHDAVWVPTRDYIDRVKDGVKRRRERAAAPVEDWSSMDLAVAWQRRLRERGFNIDLGGLKPLAVRFKALQDTGASNVDLDAMSETFFADDRRWAGKVKGDLWRLFISLSTGLLLEQQGQTSTSSGGYRYTQQPAISPEQRARINARHLEELG